MRGRTVAGLAALGGLGLLLTRKKEQPSVGFAPSVEQIEVALARVEVEDVDLDAFETTEPRCGCFYQSRRGDTWLGQGDKSITYRALLPYGEAIARSSTRRLELLYLVLSGQWQTEVYGTFAYRAKTPVGPHGRGIDLVPCFADNRTRLLNGEAPLRTVPEGRPQDARTGFAAIKRGGHYPYVWIPLIDESKLPVVTTEGVRWPDGSSTIEPPPEIRALGVAYAS